MRRCLALAEALAERGAGVTFAVTDEGPVLDAVRGAGVEARGVPADEAVTLDRTRALAREMAAGILVLDSYRAEPQAIARGGAPLMAVIDDLADRPLPVDLVVNGLAGAESLPYQVAAHTRLLLGPRYALLRRPFRAPPARPVAARPGRVLITTGGEDRAGLVPRLVDAVAGALSEVVLDVVVGPLFANAGEIQRSSARWPGRVTLHQHPADLSDLMRRADVAVTGGGQTTYELAATGTPAVAIPLAANQERTLRALEAAGTLTVVWRAADRGLPSVVAEGLKHLADDPQARDRQSQAGRRLVDGRGAERVAGVLLGEEGA